MAQKRVELRREQILEAAVRQVQRHGLAATLVAGVSPAPLFYHFETKERPISPPPRAPLSSTAPPCGWSSGGTA